MPGTVATTRTNFNRLDQSSAFGDIFQMDSDGSNKTQVNLIGSTVDDLVLNNIGTTSTLPNADYYPSVSNIYPAPTAQGNKFAFIYHNATGHYGLMAVDRNHAAPVFNDINVVTNVVLLPAYNGNGTIARWYPSQVAWANSGNLIAFTSYRPATNAADNQTFYTDVSIIDLTKAAGTAPTVVGTTS